MDLAIFYVAMAAITGVCWWGISTGSVFTAIAGAWVILGLWILTLT